MQRTQSLEDKSEVSDGKEVFAISAGSGWKGDEAPLEEVSSAGSATTGSTKVDFDLSVLMGDETAQWFKVNIADIDYLKDDFNHESFRAYKQASSLKLTFCNSDEQTFSLLRIFIMFWFHAQSWFWHEQQYTNSLPTETWKTKII